MPADSLRSEKMSEYQLQVKSKLHDWEPFGTLYTDADQAKVQLRSIREIVGASKVSAKNKVEYRLVMREVTPWCEVAE